MESIQLLNVTLMYLLMSFQIRLVFYVKSCFISVDLVFKKINNILNLMNIIHLIKGNFHATMIWTNIVLIRKESLYELYLKLNGFWSFKMSNHHVWTINSYVKKFSNYWNLFGTLFEYWKSIKTYLENISI